MVESKSRRWMQFAVFVIPAIALYGLFFIYPFFQGLGISFTNWDGLSQRSPISMEKAEFEASILNKLSKQSDRDYLLSVYRLDGDTYRRESLSGLNRVRIDSLMSKAGYENPNNKFIGLDNYKAIFTGKLDPSFYPRFYDRRYFNKDSDLPASFPQKSYESFFLAKLDAGQKSMASAYYSLKDGQYVLSADKDKSTFEDEIWNLPALSNAGKDSEIDEAISSIEDAGVSGDAAALDAGVQALYGLAKLSDADKATVKDAAQKLYDLGSFRVLLGTQFYEHRFDLGVVGFTLFFTVFSVLLSNLLAFFLALALDTNIKSKNVLRSVFFMPNVLSMIVVALIWSILFGYLLPKTTGILEWMSDLDKAPWLVVLVSVWQSAGYYMVIYLAGLQGIPTEIMEAAKIDGAGWWSRLRHIVMPMLMPAFTICIFLSTANALKCFDLMYALTPGSGKTMGTMNLVMDIYNEAYMRKSFGLATAKAVVLFGAIFVVTGIQLRTMNKKEVEL